MSYLEAIYLLKNRAATELSAAELETIREAIRASPAILSVLPGERAIEHYLAEAEAFLAATAIDEPPSLPPASAKSPPDWKNITAYVSVLMLFAAAGWFIYQLFPTEPAWQLAEREVEPIAQQEEPAEVATDGAPDNSTPEQVRESSHLATAAASSLPARAEATPSRMVAADERNDEHHWNDWQITAGKGVTLERAKDWYRSDYKTHRHGMMLGVTGGPLKLSKRLNLREDLRWLQLQARPETPLREPGKIVVRLNGQVRQEIAIGKGTSHWPAYVELRDAQDRAALVEIEYLPGRPEQRITWVRIEPAAQQGLESLPVCALAVQLLKAEQEAQRIQAIQNTRQRSDAFTEFVLLDIATGSDPSPKVQAEAFAVLVDRQDAVIRQELADYLQGVNDAELLRESLQQLVHRPAPEFMPLLLKTVQHHESADVRLQALVVMRRLDTTETVSVLLNTARGDSDPRVQGEAMSLLAARNDPAVRQALVAYLQGVNDPAIIGEALRQLIHRPFPELVPVLSKVLQQQAAAELRLQAVRILQHLNVDTAAPVLLQTARNDADASVRGHAMAVMLNRKNSADLQDLAGHLQGLNDPLILGEALRQLEHRPAIEFLPLLAKVLQRQQPADLRQQAVRVLQRLNTDESTALLLNAWNQNDPVLRPLLVQGLARREHQAIEQIMIAVLAGSDDAQLKVNAAQHFQARPSEAAIPALRTAAESDHNPLKDHANEALKRIETVLVHQK